MAGDGDQEAQEPAAAIRHFPVAKMCMGQFFPGEAPVRSMDFHSSGNLLVTCNEQNTITIINAVEGKLKKKLHSHIYGAGIVRYTHHEQSILHTSALEDDHAVRYLSVYNNAYLRFFRGHTGRVVSMAMSPIDDRFLTGSADGTVRLWELGKEGALAVLRMPDGASPPMVAYDPQGIVFMVACSKATSNVVKFYDAQNFVEGPFLTSELQHGEIADFVARNVPSLAKQAEKLAAARWTRLSPSLDGQSIVIATAASLVLRLDAWEGTLKQAYSGHVNRSGSEIDACCSPDSKWVVSGSEDASLRVWEAESGTLAATLPGHDGPVTCVAFSSKLEVAATADRGTALWIAPPLDEPVPGWGVGISRGAP